MFKTFIQYVIPHHALSRFVGVFTKSTNPKIKTPLINWFVNHYPVNMDEAKESDPHKYESFNDFFTRELKSEARIIDSEPGSIICPVDGAVSQVGDIKNDRIFQAKKFEFSLETLLGGDEVHAEPFKNGKFATLYLSPKDYHRVHMPITGTLREMVYIPGRIFSVNRLTTHKVPNLFARNERVVCFFDTAIGPVAIILVGAMICASINTVWHGEVTPPRVRDITVWRYEGDDAKEFKQGEQLGHFQLGSTVILVFPPNKVKWTEEMKADKPVQFGQVIAKSGM